MPPYVPTFVLWALTPLLLFGFGDQFQLTRVLSWSANPVLALFLGGFALSVAASRYGIDSLIARLAVPPVPRFEASATSPNCCCNGSAFNVDVKILPRLR